MELTNEHEVDMKITIALTRLNSQDLNFFFFSQLGNKNPPSE